MAERSHAVVGSDGLRDARDHDDVVRIVLHHHVRDRAPHGGIRDGGGARNESLEVLRVSQNDEKNGREIGGIGWRKAVWDVEVGIGGRGGEQSEVGFEVVEDVVLLVCNVRESPGFVEFESIDVAVEPFALHRVRVAAFLLLAFAVVDDKRGVAVRFEPGGENQLPELVFNLRQLLSLNHLGVVVNAEIRRGHVELDDLLHRDGVRVVHDHAELLLPRPLHGAVIDRVDAVLVDLVRRHALLDPNQRSKHPTRLLLAVQHRVVIDSVRRTRHFSVRVVQIDQEIRALRRALLLTHSVQPVERRVLGLSERIIHRTRIERGVRSARRNQRAGLHNRAVRVVLIEDVQEARAQATV